VRRVCLSNKPSNPLKRNGESEMSRKHGPTRFLLRVTRMLSAKRVIRMCSLLVLLASCLRNPVIAQTQDVVLVGAADIGRCGTTLAHSQATAALLDSIPGKVFVAGDLGYPNGAETEFARCYDPLGDGIGRGPPRRLEFTTSSLRLPKVTSIISGPSQAIQVRATTATVTVRGTL
jgi:hypothetical protein